MVAAADILIPDPVALTQALIRRESVTPIDDGALTLVAEALTALGFACHPLVFQRPGAAPVHNLYARRGDNGPHFCFAGHTDVVPPGDLRGWSVPPFGGVIDQGFVYGRGAADMKGAIGAFIAGVATFLHEGGLDTGGSVSLLITGDEEGPALDGTAAVLRWLRERGEHIDACIVGEPTSVAALGDMVKIGRRGSMNVTLTAHGVQGHVAYPHLADNPLPRLAKLATLLAERPLDNGSEHFQPSALVITSLDVGNAARNVIPAKGELKLNIRFNDRHTPNQLETMIRETLHAVGGRWEMQVSISGEAFLTPPGPLVDALCQAIIAKTGRTPELSTSGGTSDARFIKDMCPVVEFGLPGASMHKTDERAASEDLHTLAAIYADLLRRYFAGQAA
jgi:succinyl-diaminopimelate desuccinylase